METEEKTAAAQLEKMIELQRKTLRQSRITALAFLALLAVTVIALAYALPKLLSLASHADEVLTTTTELAAAVGTFVEDTRPMLEDVSSLVANANGLIVDNTEAVAGAVEKLNGIDIDRLNEAIGGLATAVQPLARLGEMFGGR